MIKRFLNDESGATAIEYAIIAGIIGIALVTTLTTLRTQINGVFTAIGSALSKVK